MRGNKTLTLCRIVAAAVLFCPFCGAGRTETPSPAAQKTPNILLISLDTLRADHLGCYGYGRDTSPNLDKFAKEGILFESATAASSWTVPSHMSLFTSLYPSVHGVVDTQKQLGEAVPTMAEILAKQGYTTAAFVTGPSLNHAMGFHRGFQLYDDFTVALMYENNLFHDTDVEKSGVNQVPTNHVVTNLATTWLKKHGQERFFLFVHYWDCHSDYIPPAPFDRKFDPDYQGPEDGRNVAGRHAQLEQSASPEVKKHLMALYDGEILYAVERDTTSAVIGPTYEAVGISATAHEFGGMYMGSHFPIRAFMGPALEAIRPRLPDFWLASVK